MDSVRREMLTANLNEICSQERLPEIIRNLGDHECELKLPFSWVANRRADIATLVVNFHGLRVRLDRPCEKCAGGTYHLYAGQRCLKTEDLQKSGLTPQNFAELVANAKLDFSRTKPWTHYAIRSEQERMEGKLLHEPGLYKIKRLN